MYEIIWMCTHTILQGFNTIKEMYGNLDDVKILTLAPELDHSGEVIEKLTSDNIIVSLGNT